MIGPTRRTVLAAALLPLAACASPRPQEPPPTITTPPPKVHDALFELERKFGARLGVYALNTGSGVMVEHRADERFAFCSTFKGLVTGHVLAQGLDLNMNVRYTEAELMKSSVVTRKHVGTGMTLRDLCDAAVRYSDGTAGNLLLRLTGGPNALTAYLRGLGDDVTRMDRIEPDITTAIPDDPRDTSTPRALGTTYRKLVIGDGLQGEKQAFLRDLMERNTTGDQRIRAGVPSGWKVADKTGTGDYGTLNDIAVGWPPGKAPCVISIMSSKPTADAKYDQALLVEAAAYAATELG